MREGKKIKCSRDSVAQWCYCTRRENVSTMRRSAF